MLIEVPDYLQLVNLISLIDEPDQTACMHLYKENETLFKTAPGSATKHQAWPGGYYDHITDGMNYLRLDFYALLNATKRPFPFTESSALKVFFCHDLEKLFNKYELNQHGIAVRKEMQDKQNQHDFKMEVIHRYGINLSEEEFIALKYVEGEGKDYDRTKRVMNELGALCSRQDLWSARGTYDYPLATNDPWVGALRINN